MNRRIDSRPATASEITAILADWSGRDEQALDKLPPVVFEELRKLASFYFLREAPGHTHWLAASAGGGSNE